MKLIIRKIKEPQGPGQYIVKEYEDFEFVNPIKQVKEMYVGSLMSFERDLLLMNGFTPPEDILRKLLLKRALINWKKELEHYKSIKIPESLIDLLEADKKKDQINCLKGLSLTTDELVAFLFTAFEKHGFTYSQYKASHNHEGLDENELPALIHVEDNGTVKTIGKTNLTTGQLKQVVDHRKVMVSKFLDNGEKWHCFFLTFKSLRGEESYKDGQPHLHYISNLWNIPRQEVKEQLTSKTYNLPSLPHIDFYTDKTREVRIMENK